MERNYTPSHWNGRSATEPCKLARPQEYPNESENLIDTIIFLAVPNYLAAKGL